MAANSTLNAVGDGRHARNNERVRPVAIERRRQKQLAFLDGCNAVRNHNARHQPGYAQVSRKLLFELGVLLSDRPAMCMPASAGRSVERIYYTVRHGRKSPQHAAVSVNDTGNSLEIFERF